MRSYPRSRLSRSSNPFKPGSWEPGRFGLPDAVTIKLVLILMAANRSFDYFTPRVTSPTTVTETMQTAFPLWWWGIMLAVPTILLATGLAARVHFAVWMGHGLLAIVYLGIVTALGMVYIERPLFDGSRSVTALLAPLVLHTLLCARTGWRPPTVGTMTGEFEEVREE